MLLVLIFYNNIIIIIIIKSQGIKITPKINVVTYNVNFWLISTF